MNYTKPEVAEMGQAVRVIEQLRKIAVGTDGQPPKQFAVNPAYDMDE